MFKLCKTIKYPKIYEDFLSYQKNLDTLWTLIIENLKNQEKASLLEDIENLELWIEKEEKARESFLNLWQICDSLLKDFSKSGYIHSSKAIKFQAYWQDQKDYYLLKKISLLKTLKNLLKKISHDHLDFIKSTPFRLKASFHSKPQALQLFI